MQTKELIRYNKKLINNLIFEAVSNIKSLGYNIIPWYDEENKVEFSQSKQNMGECVTLVMPRKNKKYITLRFSKYLLHLDDYSFIRNVVYHELVHAIDLPRNKGHNLVWQGLAKTINKEFNVGIEKHYDIKLLLYLEEKGLINIKYKFKCEKCGSLVLNFNKCKFIDDYQNYSCGKCGGKFERIK